MSLFENNVAAIPAINRCYKRGLQSLGTDSVKVVLKHPRKCEGSVNLDDCLKAALPNENRWDYMFSYKDKVYFVEVHPAQTSEVRLMLRKLGWLKNWLQTQAPSIERQKAPNAFIWIASGRTAILPTSPQYRLVIQKGLKPMSILQLS
jgi:hypothetical protein